MTWRERLRDLVETRTGIRPGASGSDAHLQRFVRTRMRATYMHDEEEYLARLERDPEEQRLLLGIVSVAHTWFLRDQDQLDAMAQAWRRSGADRPARIWSAGCCTGEEAYSVALKFLEAGLPCEVVGSDLNPDWIEHGRRGAYSESALRQVDQERRRRWFQSAGQVPIIDPSLRRAVRFVVHNIASEPPPRSSAADGRWDLIVCRNVFIYWTPERVARAVRAMCAATAPDGWLFFGVADSMSSLNVPLEGVEFGTRVGFRPQRENGHRQSVAPGASRPRLESTASIDTAESQQQRGQSAGGWLRVRRLLDSGELLRAKTAVELLLRDAPEHIPAQVTLGNILLRLNNIDASIQAYAAAQALDPLMAEVHLFTGIAYRKAGALSQAEQALRRALFLEDGCLPASYLLATTYDRLGRHDAAKRQYSRTLELLKGGVAPPLFQSHTLDLEALEVPKHELIDACQRRLGADAGDASGKD